MKPGFFTFGGNRGIVQSGLTVDLDATRSDSFSSGQVWTDLKGLSHMHLGTTSGSDATDPTFVSTVPRHFTTDGGDYFTSVAANTGTLVRQIGRSDTAFSLEVWGYVAGLDVTTDKIVCNRSTGPGDNFSFQESVSTIGDLALQFAGVADNLAFTPTQSAWRNWFISAIPDGTANGVKIYENAVLQAQATITSPWTSGDSNGAFTIFATSGGVTLAESTWRISVLRIYNRVLSANEVSQNFNAYRTMFGV